MNPGQMLTLAALGDVEVSVAVTLGGARCRVSDVLAFTEGSVVMLGTRAEAPVDVLVNGVVVAGGDIVELDDGALAVEIRYVRATERESQDPA
jgi:flagellar motor switch protein FliN